MQILKFRFAFRDCEKLFEITADRINITKSELLMGAPHIQLTNAEMFEDEGDTKKPFTPEHNFSVEAVTNDIFERIVRGEHVDMEDKPFGLIEVVFVHDTIKDLCAQYEDMVYIQGHKVPRKIVYGGYYAVLFAATENVLYYSDFVEPLLMRYDGTIVGDVGEIVEGAFIGDKENGLLIWEDPDYKSRLDNSQIP